MSDIAVSVCIITYKHEKYIRQALDSVFMQKTNFDFEVIVGEDASPDNTRQILLEYKEKYGDKLILVLHDENVGVSKNGRSLGPHIRGKYVASLEGDDYWTDEYKLQKQYDLLENNPRYSAVCSDFMSVNPEGEVLKSSVLNLKKDIVKTMHDWIYNGYSLHTCTIFRRNIFPPYSDEKYARLRTAEPTMGDLITFTLLYDAGDIYVIHDVMSAHRMAGKNDTASFSYANRTKAIEYTYMFARIIRNLEEYLEHRYNLTPRLCWRIAVLKLEKLRGNIQYDEKEMRKLMGTLSVKNRIWIYYKMVELVFKKCLIKLGLYHG